jgi:hypothetical protein
MNIWKRLFYIWENFPWLVSTCDVTGHSAVRFWLLCDRASWKILIIKPNRCTGFSNLFLEWNSTCFAHFLCSSSGVLHCTRSNAICHTGVLTAFEQYQEGTSWSCSKAVWHNIAVCTVKNSWWWTEELSETRRVSFQE